MQVTAEVGLAERAVYPPPVSDPSAAEQWVTMEELSEEIRVPLRTLYKWRSDGRAPRGARFGKHIRMKRVDVDAWIATRMDVAK